MPFCAQCLRRGAGIASLSDLRAQAQTDGHAANDGADEEANESQYEEESDWTGPPSMVSAYSQWSVADSGYSE